MWRQLEGFSLQQCGLALSECVAVLARFYFSFGFRQAVDFFFLAVLCCWLQELAKWDDTVACRLIPVFHSEVCMMFSTRMVTW